MMLNKGADPNAVNSSGACCLHFACYRESASFQVAKVLLQSGANPDVAESTYGCTPLHYCAGTGDIKFCKLLLSYGAQIASRDYYNYTCVDYAKEAQMLEVRSLWYR
jgi:ankyrin repeat protein